MSGDNDKPEDDEPRTVFAPLDSTALPGGQRPAAPSPPPSQQQTPVSRPEGRIEVGDVLNHIFEVTRFIARGGMGEVYEGINVNTDERVAIKVMLPALAADANVQAMFRKEAKTLTRLSHPALVQYRVLAQEPHLKVLYIVTDYIHGSNLSDVLGTVPRDAASLAGLLRRLADGLRVAHDLGAVHRDIAPDNILLEDGLLDRARIIDFGIAKDLDPSKGTIVGDGFAGKLNYVAPEQLGDFGREVGPWSDIYSLALVILTIAGGQRIDMGATLVDAVDKRRAGVDVSVAPASLRPVLEAMLRANPRERLRSMAEVVAMLDGAPVPAAPPAEPARRKAKAGKPPKAPASGAEASPSFLARNKLLVAGGAGVGALALIGITALVLTGSPDGGGAAGNSAAPAAAARPPVDVARDAITAALPGLGCSWLDLHDLKDDRGELAARFGGVAGNTAAAQASLSSAVTAKGVRIAKVDFEDVAPIQPVACAALDAYRALKSPVAGDLVTDQVKYEKSPIAVGAQAGQSAAVPQIHISANALREDIAIIGIETSGAMTDLIPDKATLLKLVSNPDTDTGSLNADGSITLKVTQGDVGWAGILTVRGRGPFDPALVAPPPMARGADWRARLDAAAKAKGWKADMVWFKIVDEVPDT